MNTEDERREEYTRKVAFSGSKSQELAAMSQSDLINVLNGSVLCAFEPTDLSDLRRENSIQFCFGRGRTKNRFNYFSLTKNFPFLTYRGPHSNNNNNRWNVHEQNLHGANETEIERLNNDDKKMNFAITKSSSFSIESINQINNQSDPNFINQNKRVFSFSFF